MYRSRVLYTTKTKLLFNEVVTNIKYELYSPSNHE